MVSSEQALLDESLTQLQREDPSLQVVKDGDTGQTLIKGRGEMHGACAASVRG